MDTRGPEVTHVENTIMRDKMQDAGVPLPKEVTAKETMRGVGRGKGVVRVSRMDLIDFFVKHPGLKYSKEAIANALQAPSRSVGIHLGRMHEAGMVSMSNVGGKRRYMGVPDQLLDKKNWPKKVFEAHKETIVVATKDTPKPERKTLGVRWKEGEKRTTEKSLPPLMAEKPSITEQINRLERVLKIAIELAHEVKTEHAEMREKLEKLL